MNNDNCFDIAATKEDIGNSNENFPPFARIELKGFDKRGYI